VELNHLQDSLIDKIEGPFLPLTRPDFHEGTLMNYKISSPGTFPSAKRLSGNLNIESKICTLIPL